mgnify:CR=1 FL=1
MLRDRSTFSNVRVLIIGDIILDHFMWGNVTRISPEAPVPVVDITNESKMLGGAANVLENVCSLGAQASICGMIGNDQAGQDVLELVKRLGVRTDGIIQEDRHFTPMKLRVIAGNQQIVRADKELVQENPLVVYNKIARYLHRNEFDVVIISDYKKGLVSQALIEILQFSDIPVILDTKSGDISYCRNTTVITSNLAEVEYMTGIKAKGVEDFQRIGKKFFEAGCAAALVTRGKDGMVLLEPGDLPKVIPAKAKEVYDVSGAGDTVTAVMALCIASGLSYFESAELANMAAGVVVGKVGTASITQEELFECLI